MAQRHTVSHLGGVDTQLENLDPAANQPEDFRRWVVDYQRTAFSSRIQDLRHLFAVGIRRSGYGQHHTRDGVGQRPVDKLLGDKCLVRDDDLFTVPVADGGGTGVDPVTLPVRSRMVTVSPIRIGFSNRMIRPETKLAKISCKPKPGLRSGRQPAIAVLTIRYQSSRSRPAHQTA